MCRTIPFHASLLIVCLPLCSTPLAIAVDSVNTVRNPGFDTPTPLGQSAAWTSLHFTTHAGNPICPTDGITIEQNVAGHAQCVQLNPLYQFWHVDLGGYACSFAPSCNPKFFNATQQVWLEQIDIPCAASDYVEVAFDFRLEDRMPACAPVCEGVYRIARVIVTEVPLPDALQIGDGVGVGEIQHSILSDAAPLGAWARQRIGMQRMWTSSTLSLKVILSAGALTESTGYVYGAALNLDNVSVKTFGGTCALQQWDCASGSEEICFPGEAVLKWTGARGVETPIAANDTDEAFQCDRPCPASCPADIDGDGVVGGGDLAYVLGSWGTIGGIADIDHNGVVGGGDLAYVLGSWGCGG
ncbi:MAG: hypothetical protein EXS10_03975 [Phycisphaerales bacterium]|nr:hypothetical protein [Phycisphaerales bacterium]